MMLYLTGANASLSKSPENPQSDVNKSLGGYISSTPVPNSAINALFDTISSLTLERRYKETFAIGLVNKFDTPVTNVSLKIVSNDENIAEFKVAAIEVDKLSYSMEHIDNRYQEPMQVEFYNADFYRAAVEVEILNPAIAGEEMVLYPFDVDINILASGIEGTYEAINKAFSNDNVYRVKRLSETKFRIERQDETIEQNPFLCSFITSDNAVLSFSGLFQNKLDNSVILKDELLPDEAIGIWLQRIIKGDGFQTNEKLLEDYELKRILSKVEEVELIISYEII